MGILTHPAPHHHPENPFERNDSMESTQSKHPGIREGLEVLYEHLVELGDEISMLLDRLEPVSAPTSHPPPSDPRTPETGKQLSSPCPPRGMVVCQVEKAKRMVVEHIDTVRHLKSRLEI